MFYLNCATQKRDAALKRRLEPLSRRLHIKVNNNNPNSDDEDAAGYEGRVKFMENMIAAIVDRKVEQAKAEIIKAIREGKNS